jgi:hypothetical protein
MVKTDIGRVNVYTQCTYCVNCFLQLQGKCTKFSFSFTKPSLSIFGGVSANGLGF